MGAARWLKIGPSVRRRQKGGEGNSFRACARALNVLVAVAPSCSADDEAMHSFGLARDELFPTAQRQTETISILLSVWCPTRHKSPATAGSFAVDDSSKSRLLSPQILAGLSNK